jgi:hypothetical protein
MSQAYDYYWTAKVLTAAGASGDITNSDGRQPFCHTFTFSIYLQQSARGVGSAAPPRPPRVEAPPRSPRCRTYSSNVGFSVQLVAAMF